MADYVTRNSSGYDLSLKGPYVNEGVNMNLHVLNAELLPLWRTIKRYLNDPPGKGWYSPFGDRVLVSCTDVRKGMVGDETLGSMHEVEVSFFILAVYCNPFPIRIVSFAPYLFVNNAWAMVTGREILGFRKDLATSFATTDVDGPGWQHRADDIRHVETWAMRERGKASRLERMKLLEIEPPANPASSPDLGDLVSAFIGSGIDSLAKELAEFLPIAALKDLSKSVEDLLTSVVTGLKVEVPMVFLRQFRDARSTRYAQVQEVLQAKAVGHMTALPSRLEPSRFRFHHADSHPIADELGLKADTWLTSDLSLDVNLDFTLSDAD
jgi:hypothetical protein